ncbi:MAG: DUF86 domain-containing protein [Vallitaleaceae bacterium]|nr:DUF86 domain-containing protein [Vallitaleaceae bacterium]
MKDKHIIILEKLLKYCKDSIKYTETIEYNEFINNELFLTFSVFSLSQVGELTNKLDADVYKLYPNIPWNAMRGIRNRIIHDYEGLSHQILWDTLKKDIPKLIIQLELILNT